MKHFANWALAVLTSFICAGSLIAQDYAPLIQKDTISITQVNLSNLTSEELVDSIQKIGSAAIDYFMPETDNSQMKESLPIISMIAEQAFVTNIQPLKEAGAEKIYFVVDQPKDSSVTLYPYLAVPTQDMSDTQKKQLRDAFSLLNKQIPEGSQFTLKYRLDRNGFYFVLLVPTELSTDEVKTYTKKHFAKLNTVQKPEFTAGFEAIDPNAVFSSVSLIAQNDEIVSNQLEKAFAQIDEIPNVDEFSNTLKDVITKLVELSNSMTSHVKYNYSYVSLKNLELVSCAQAKSEKDAEEYITSVNNKLLPTINEMLDKLWENLGKADENTPKETLEDAKEHIKKLIGVFCQFDVQGTVITWKIDKDFWVDNKATFTEFVNFLKANIPSESEEAEFEEL